VLAISDRVVVMREGRVTGEVGRESADQERLMGMMTLGGKAAADDVRRQA
jgi:ABC-type sugar transport system ATPase subunit